MGAVRPVTQTRTGRPCGNCWAAAIASILEVPLEAVDWSAELAPEEIEPDGPDGEAGPRYHALREERLDALGVWILEVPVDNVAAWPADYFPPDAFVLGYGPNPDGVPHVVVWQGPPTAGRMVWDPNPLRRGLARLESVGFLILRGSRPCLASA